MIEVLGRIVDIVPTMKKTIRFTVETDGLEAAEGLEGLATSAPGEPSAPLIKIKLAKARKARSLDANAYFWACVSIIADATGQSKNKVYLQMLKRYGVYTYLVVKEDAVDRLRMIWREIEVLGDTVTQTGAKGKSVLAFFGSSTYDSKEMSRLIDGTVSEITEMGLTPPPTKEINELIEDWRKHHG